MAAPLVASQTVLTSTELVRGMFAHHGSINMLVHLPWSSYKRAVVYIKHTVSLWVSSFCEEASKI
jgi:hypothetical protein